MSSEEPAEDLDQLADRVRTRARALGLGERVKRFPEVRGLCGSCKNAHITRREYDGVLAITCHAMWEHPYRVPLDVMECNEYEKRGEVGLGDMVNIFLPIDKRDPGGQYL